MKISYNKKKITWPLGDTDLKSCVENISHSFASLTRKRYYQHSKINSVSPHSHVTFSIYQPVSKLTLSAVNIVKPFYLLLNEVFDLLFKTIFSLNILFIEKKIKHFRKNSCLGKKSTNPCYLHIIAPPLIMLNFSFYLLCRVYRACAYYSFHYCGPSFAGLTKLRS